MVGICVLAASYLLPSRRREGLGVGLRKGRFDMRHHAFEVCHHIGIGKAQDLETERTAVNITPNVMIDALIVARAVKFDDEFQFSTEKISEIGSDRHLAAEFLP
jgi:hypothetical protein